VSLRLHFWLTLLGGAACGVTTDSRNYCWGWSGAGQLGDGSTDNSSVPVAVSSPLGAIIREEGYGARP
jgi:alpha-tubulin suppressor-like RCC1 family protein